MVEGFPLPPELRVVLERQRDLTEVLQWKQGRIIPWIFHRGGKPIRQMQKDWNRATDAAGLEGRASRTVCGAPPSGTSSARACRAPRR